MRLHAFLLRHGRRYPGRTNWTKSHERWIAEQRLCGRFARLSSRGMQVNKVCVVVARELAGFVWSIAHQASRTQAH